MSRTVFYVPIDAYVVGYGYRVSVVTDTEGGHRPTGHWPYEGKPGQCMPYFWGHDFEEACRIADQANERLGYTKREAAEVVAMSMALGRRRRPS